MISPICLPRPFSVAYWLLSQLTILRSKALKILHASSNNCLFIKKLSLMELWCTANRFLEFTCGSHILSLRFICLNFWKFANCYKSTWNFTQMTESVFVEGKTYFGLPWTHLSALAASSWFHLYAFRRLF